MMVIRKEPFVEWK